MPIFPPKPARLASKQSIIQSNRMSSSSLSLNFGPNTEVRLFDWSLQNRMSTARILEDGRTLQVFPSRKIFNNWIEWVTSENARTNIRLIIIPEGGPAYSNYTLPTDKKLTSSYEEMYGDGYASYAGYADDGGFGEDGDGAYDAYADDERRVNGYTVEESAPSSPAAGGGAAGGGGGGGGVYLPGTKLCLSKDGEPIAKAVILKSGEAFQYWPNRGDPSTRHYDTPEEWRASVEHRRGVMTMTTTMDDAPRTPAPATAAAAPAPMTLGQKRVAAAREAAGRRKNTVVTEVDRIRARLARLEMQLA
jgi:hypothetical protein